MKEKINIIHLLNGGDFAGVDRVAINIGQEISRDLFHIIFVLLRENSQTFISKAKEIGTEYKILPMKNKMDFTTIFKLRKFIRDNNVKLVHTHEVRSSLIGRLAASMCRIPVVTHIHSPIIEDTENVFRNRVNYLIDKFTWKLTDKFISVSNYLKEMSIKQGISREKICTVYNGIHSIDDRVVPTVESEHGISSKTLLVGSVALFRHRKGIEYLIKAAADVIKIYDNVNFLLVGSFETKQYEKEIKSLIKKMGIENKFTFTGFRNDISKLMFSLDLFVLPSLYGEGLPMVILEAMSLSKPVIATDIGGISEVVEHNFNGLVVPPQDIVMLSEGMIKLIEDRRLLKKMGEKGNQIFLKRFTAKKMTKKIENIYDNVISDFN